MPRIGSRYLVWAFSACLGLWAFLGQGQEAAAVLSYRGSWDNNENDDGRLVQNYGHFFQLSTNRDLIGRLTSEENVSYNYRWEQEGEARESISPGASLKLSGDIFLASLAVNSTKTLKTRTSQADTLGFIWASCWNKRFFPALQANYDYSRQRTDSFSSRSEENRQAIGTQITWDLLVAQLFYSYRRNDGNHSVYQDTNDNNLARVDSSRTWLDDRLQVSVGYEFNKSTNEQRIPFNSTTTTTNVFLALTRADAGPDTTPSDTDDGTLVAAPFLLNDAVNPLLAPAYTATAANNSNCIRLQTDGQPVDRIFLYTLTNLGPVPTPLGVDLRVYTNDNILINPWTQVLAVAWSYDSINQRFVIVLPAVKANYVKLVVDLTGITTIDFTEVEAEQVVHGTVESTVITSRTSQADKSNFTASFQLNKKVAFFYNLLLQKDERDSTTLSQTESHNGGVRMRNSAGDFKSILAYSLSRQRYAASPEVQSESYNLSVNKVVLPTLSVSLSGSRDNMSQAGAKISTRDRYAFYADALLYPDLNSQLETVYSDLTDYSSGIVNGRDTLDSKITFTSRFSPSLNVSIYDAYVIRNQSARVSNKLNTIGLSSNWQVSDLLSMYALVTRNSDNFTSQDAYAYSAGLVAGYASGFELQASYSLQAAESRSQSGRAALRWASNRNVSCEIGCNYTKTDVAEVRNVYKFYSQVAVNFSTL